MSQSLEQHSFKKQNKTQNMEKKEAKFEFIKVHIKNHIIQTESKKSKNFRTKFNFLFGVKSFVVFFLLTHIHYFDMFDECDRYNVHEFKKNCGV